VGEAPVRIWWLVVHGGDIKGAFPYELRGEADAFAEKIGATVEPGAMQGWFHWERPEPPLKPYGQYGAAAALQAMAGMPGR
jgi:hypothetical protein